MALFKSVMIWGFILMFAILTSQEEITGRALPNDNHLLTQSLTY